MNRKTGALLLAAGLMLAGCSATSSSAPAADASSAVPSSAGPSLDGAASGAPSPTAAPKSEPTADWAPGYLPQFAAPEPGTPIVTLRTDLGDIRLMLFPQAAPLAVESFVTHCREGYYDGVTFHRVMADFMIQGGDPLGTGMGGESIWGIGYDDEFSNNLFNFRGALSLANSNQFEYGRYATNGSQFFIVQEDAVQYPDSPYRVTDENAEAVMMTMLQNRESHAVYMKLFEKLKEEGVSEEAFNAFTDETNAVYAARMQQGLTAEDRAAFAPAVAKYKELGGTPTLDFKHTVFGQVLEGMDVVDAIAKVETIDDGSGNLTKPAKDVVIRSVTVETAK